MSTELPFTVELAGCRPRPLAHYLKALGVLRVVGEQADPQARGWWDRDQFTLRTRLDTDDLVDFFLTAYRPSPIVSPWNGGAGFFEGDKAARVVMDRIRAADAERFGAWHAAIDASFAALRAEGIGDEKPKDFDKRALIARCRATWPDEALPWIDASTVLTNEKADFPPLLGTGGNDGRLDFSSNYMQRIVRCLLDGDSAPDLRAALFGATEPVLRDDAIGQFFPGAAGGANNTTGFDGKAQSNMWDYILLLEGSLVFAAAATRQMTAGRAYAASAPFTVRAVAAGANVASEDEAKAARAELWMPLWKQPTSAAQVQLLFHEGRISAGSKAARDGFDVAKALTKNAFLQGIFAFERYGIHVRNGLSYFATPLERIEVRQRERVSRLAAVEPWVDRFLSAAQQDRTPASVQRAARGLREAVFAAAAATTKDDEKHANLALLDALVDAQRAMIRSFTWTTGSGAEGRTRPPVPPVPWIAADWLDAVADGSAECALGTSLGTLAIPLQTASKEGGPATTSWLTWRSIVEPVAAGRKAPQWLDPRSADEVWIESALETALLRGMRRRALQHERLNLPGWEMGRASDGQPLVGLGRRARTSDIAQFIAGHTDDALIERWFRRALLVKPGATHAGSSRRTDDHPLPVWALCKLACPGAPVLDRVVKADGALLAKLEQGRGGTDATQHAHRRLRALGVSFHVPALPLPAAQARRIAASLAFPIHPEAVPRLLEQLAFTPPTAESSDVAPALAASQPGGE